MTNRMALAEYLDTQARWRETIAEQYRIMTADRDLALVVQGGPGTGKTVVGLHRAAYLAFNNEDLRRSGL